MLTIARRSFGQTPTDEFPVDPGAISVSTYQNLSFGTFSQGGAGGTLTVTNSSTRTATGSVVPLNMGASAFASIFELEAPSGTIVSITNGPDATLTGSNGGSMTLHINNSTPLSPFSTSVPPPGKTQITIGGTLTIGSPASAPPGAYSGSFYVTFNQE